MNSYVEYALVNNKKYKINTDFRVALKCNEVAESNVLEEERALAIIYLLFGEKGLSNSDDWEGLLKIATKYLNIKKENNSEEKETNMSFEEDWGYIQASFFSDYNIDLSKIKMHWWQFFDLLCGLTEKCVFNRVRFVRDFDISQIKDSKERERWIEQKKQVALKNKEKIKTAEQLRLDKLFEEQLESRWCSWMVT